MIETLLVFDIDGVICDSLESRQAAWAYASKKSSLDLGTLSPELIGLPLDEILRLNGVTEDEKVRSFSSQFETQLDNDTKENLYPGAKETLGIISSIPSVQIALFSGRPGRRVLSAMEAAGLPSYTPFASADGLSIPVKPSGEGLKDIERRLGLESLRLRISVGDTHLDYLAALDAGFDFLFAGWGYGDLSLDSKSERVDSWKSLAFDLPEKLR